MEKQMKVLIAALALIALAVIAGCGGDDGDDTGNSASATSSEYLSEVADRVENLLGPKGTYVEEPTTSPTSPGEKKTIALISCGQIISACAGATGSAEEAAASLGWETTLFDAKADYPSAATGIRNALAQDVDGIFVYIVSCEFIQGALRQADDAGVPVVSAEGLDCNESDPGAEPLFDYTVEYTGGQSYLEWATSFWEAAALYAVNKYDGESKAIAFLDDDPIVDPAVDALEGVYDQCEGCSLDIVRFPLNAYGTRLQGIAEQELAKNPDVNTVIPSYEASALEIYPAVRASGRESEILTFLGEGNEAGMDLLREGANGMVASQSVVWEGRAAIDAFGRIFAGEEPVPSGNGVQLVDADHNLNDSGPSESPVDFVSMYAKAWGLEE